LIRYVVFILGVWVVGVSSVSAQTNELDAYRGRSMNHPEFGVISNRAHAAERQADSMGRWPEPQITLGYFPGMYHVSVMQMIPWPGKLSSRRDSARSQSSIESVRASALTRRLHREIETIYWELWLVRELKAGLAEQELLLQGVQQALQARVEIGMARASALHQLQLQEAMLANRRQGLKVRLDTARAKMAAALGEDLPVDYATGSAPEAKPIAEPDAVLQRIQSHPRFRELDAINSQLQMESVRAGKEGYPDFSVGFQAETGEHPYMAMVGFSLPLWRGSYGAGEDAIEARKVALEHQRRALQQSLVADARTEIANVNETARQIALYQTELIPQAESIFELAVAEFEQASGVSVLLMAQRDLVELRLEMARLKATHLQAHARLKELVGED